MKNQRISSGKCADQELPLFVETNYMDSFDVIMSRNVTFSGIHRNTQM